VTSRYKFKEGMLASTSILRMTFILTFYIYNTQGSPLIINLIHRDLTWLYIACWLVQVFYDCFIVSIELAETLRGCMKRKKSLKEVKKLNKKKRQKGLVKPIEDL
jgi:hypothetical protein